MCEGILALTRRSLRGEEEERQLEVKNIFDRVYCSQLQGASVS